MGEVVEAFLDDKLTMKVIEGQSQTYKLNILDTPGLDDSAGVIDPDQDEKNVRKILKALKQRNTLNAVWFLSNSQVKG